MKLCKYRNKILKNKYVCLFEHLHKCLRKAVTTQPQGIREQRAAKLLGIIAICKCTFNQKHQGSNIQGDGNDNL